jgi:hypothetical protein
LGCRAWQELRGILIASSSALTDRSILLAIALPALENATASSFFPANNGPGCAGAFLRARRGNVAMMFGLEITDMRVVD